MELTKIVVPDLNIKIPHRLWKDALSKSFAFLISSQPGEVVCITGPSRAGKTRLIMELKYLLAGKCDFDLTGLLPVIVVDASNTGRNGTFSTLEFMQRMLNAVEHPVYSLNNVSIDDPMAYKKTALKGEIELRQALERALVIRGVKYLFIDEAQHARYVTKGAMGAYALMDSWKCLAHAAGVVLVLVGAYPILNILKNSPHLLGRKHQIHFPRYKMTRDDLQEFSWILANYDEVMNIDSSMVSLRNCSELLYEGSLGCIGLLRGWLTRAAACAALQSTGVTRDMLIDTILSDDDRVAISEEIEEGERLLVTRSVAGSKSKAGDVKTKAKNKSRPYTRKPKRHCAGARTEVGDEE